jgi:hypothetical protein
MSGQRQSRWGLALALGALLVTMVAAPASAAVTTVRYVDDNPNATSCRGTKFHSIQAAIDASNAADIVYVCPGIYHESILIDVPGLIVQSTKPRKAHIVPPADAPGAVVVITSAKSMLRGFSIDIPAGDEFLPVQGGNGPEPECAEILAAVVVLNQNVRVIANRITATGDNTLSGECGYWIGILAGLEATDVQITQSATGDETGSEFIPLGPGIIRIKRNYIRDFKLAGVLVGGESNSRIVHNAIRSVHQYDALTCVPVNTVTENPGLVPPCEVFARAGVNPLNGILGFSIGIGAGFGAHVDILYNQVFSTLDFDLPEYIQQPLLVGIATLLAADGSRVAQNVVTQSYAGIAIDPDVVVSAGVRPTGVELGSMDVTFNRANEGYYGIIVDGIGNYVYANRTRLNVLGLVTGEGFENWFNENDSRYNFELDCLDDTSGTGTAGTANTWTDNIGYDDFPDGICESFDT